MILDSFDNAEQDITERQVIEATNEAQTILDALEKAKVNPAYQQLSYTELETIKAATMELKASLKGGDYKIIRTAIETPRQSQPSPRRTHDGFSRRRRHEGPDHGRRRRRPWARASAPTPAPPTPSPPPRSTKTKPAKLEADPETPGESSED